MENALYIVGIVGIISSIIVFFAFFDDLNVFILISICSTAIIQSMLIIGFGKLIAVNKEIADLLRSKTKDNNKSFVIPKFPKGDM